MWKKEIKAALAIVGILAPCLTQAAQGMVNPPNPNPVPSYEAGEMVKDGQLPAGYNQTASYTPNGGWDVFFTGDFLYWHLSQEGVDMGTIIDTTSSGVSGIVNGNGESIRFNPSYKPGFQVGMGFNMKGMDNWTAYGEYTWYQNKASKSVTAEEDQLLIVTKGLLLDRTVTAGSMSGKMHYHYNNALLSFNRAFYLGKKLTGNFGCGLRGLFVSQKSSIVASELSYVPYTLAALIPETGTLTLSNEQKSWALGPRCHLDTNWLLGYGFRLLGDIAGSVLYTRYTENNSTFEESTYADYSQSNAPLNTLRGITEMSIGLGWGAYFGDNNDYHFDLGASYDFDVYWNQNLNVLDNQATRTSTGTPSNTYIHGLNIALRLDF